MVHVLLCISANGTCLLALFYRLSMSDIVILTIGQIVGVAAGFYAGMRFGEDTLLKKLLDSGKLKAVSSEEFKKAKGVDEDDNECNG